MLSNIISSGNLQNIGQYIYRVDNNNNVLDLYSGYNEKNLTGLDGVLSNMSGDNYLYYTTTQDVKATDNSSTGVQNITNTTIRYGRSNIKKDINNNNNININSLTGNYMNRFRGYLEL